MPSYRTLSRYGRLIELKLSALCAKSWFALGLLLAAVSWSCDIRLMPFASLMPLLWSIAPNRSKATLFALGYHAGASWSLIAGIVRVLDTGALSAISLWLMGSAMPASVYGLLHSHDRKSQPARFGLAVIFCAFPPILTGWANPITIAGLWFPGLAWAGLLATLIILAVLASKIDLPFKILAIIMLTIFGALSYRSPAAIKIAGHITLQDFSSGRLDRHEYERLQSAANHVALDRADIHVFPEGYAGLWGHASEIFWLDMMHQADPYTILVTGAFLPLPYGGYENVAVVLDHGHAQIIKQRMPVPLGMWKPWSAASVPAGFFRGSTVDGSKGRIGVLNCYEIVVIWTVLDTMIDRPSVLLGIGNVWWGRGTNIGRIQSEILTAWGRLYNVPTAISLNE
jgi:hypothetical protein